MAGSRDSSNCRVMLVLPWFDSELIDSIPGTVASTLPGGAAAGGLASRARASTLSSSA